MSQIIHVSDSNFDSEVVSAGIPVLVDFWAPWCGPCQLIGPFLEQLASEYVGRVKVVKVNVDESTEVASVLGVKSVPTVLLFDSHEVVDVFIGARPKDAYAKAIDRYLKKWDKKAKKARPIGDPAAISASENLIAYTPPIQPGNA